MKLLFVSNLFPDEANPVRGSDNAELLRWLRSAEAVDVRVLSPRPHLAAWLGADAAHLRPCEKDAAFAPVYPSVRYVPRFGSRWNDILMERDLERSFRKAVNEFQPDAILGSWLFPDGCALARLRQRKSLPLVLVTQGTDTHGYLEDPIRKRKILDAIAGCDRVICRSGDLARRLRDAGAMPEKLQVIYNGVDSDIFHPMRPEFAKERLGIEGDAPALLFVGNFLPVKDPLFLVQAHAEWNRRRVAAGSIPARLRMIGSGPLVDTVRSEARRQDSAAEVEILGRCAPEEVALHMNAADILCLSSRNEGFPNVILEAMACRLPCLSTNVGGLAERIDETTGTLVKEGDLEGYVEALESTLAGKSSLRMDSGTPDWREVAAEYAASLREVIDSAADQGRLGA